MGRQINHHSDDDEDFSSSAMINNSSSIDYQMMINPHHHHHDSSEVMAPMGEIPLSSSSMSHHQYMIHPPTILSATTAASPSSGANYTLSSLFRKYTSSPSVNHKKQHSDMSDLQQDLLENDFQEELQTRNRIDHGEMEEDQHLKENNVKFYIPDEKKFSFYPNTVFNLSNSTIGAGILTLPFAFKSCGLILGIVILLLVGLIAVLSLHYLLNASEITKGRTYREVAIKAFKGKKFIGVIIDIVTIVFCFGVMVGYVNIVGDYMKTIYVGILEIDYFGGTTGASKGHVMATRSFNSFLAMILVMLPLSLLRKISFLSFTSYISMICMFFTMVVLFIRFCQKAPTLPKRYGYDLTLVQESGKFMEIFLAFPVLFFAFGSHFTLLPLYYEIKAKVRSRRNMAWAINNSSLVCMVCYLFVGIFGYVQFGDKSVNENILNSYKANDLLVLVCKICMIFVVGLSYPLINFVARVHIESLLFPKKKFSYFRWIVETCIISALVLLVILIPLDIVTIFGLTGASFGMILMFILPCVFYGMVETHRVKRVIAFIVAFICLLLGLISTGSVILDFVRKIMNNQITLKDF